jgi:cyclase
MMGPRRTSFGELREVADGVYAYLQPPGTWCVSNAGVLVGPDGLILVDTAATRKRAEALRRAADDLHRGPVHTVINTHHHGDHVFGNCVFEPPVTIIAHELARSEMIEAGLGLQLLWPEVEWGELTLVPPTLTFAEQLVLHLGDRRVELHHIGPAHTTNDTVVWLPESGVLFVGDVVLPGCTPFNLMGSIKGSLTALSRLRAFGAATVIGGHGEIGGPEVFEQTESYLRWVLGLAATGIAEEQSPLEVARQTDMGQFGALLDPERLVGNLHRAYLELQRPELPLGSHIDALSSFKEMIDFNGGRPLRCVA